MKDFDLEASWPFDPEIFYNLDFCPYLDLKVQFDSAPLLLEARNLLHHFVTHREKTQIKSSSGGGWKSLGLRTFEGDPHKTEYHTSYTDAKEGIYLNTIFLNQCPQILNFLNTITDINQCDRIRLMLLEPGAEILTHRDSLNRDVSLAVNISLNMPDKCEFWCDLNSDGTLSEFSKNIPFLDSGSVILFNNAKYHSLRNHSNIARIHIIFHGPIKFNDSQLLTLARNQNQIYDKKELLRKLIQKKGLQSEPLSKSPQLSHDWVISGLSHNSLGSFVKIFVIDHLDKYALENITTPSIFPLDYEVVQIKNLDQKLSSLDISQFKFCLIVSAGTFVINIHHFITECLKLMGQLKSKKAVAAGHLIDDKKRGLPHFHQQFLILNISLWMELRKVPLNSFFSEEEVHFTSYSKGEDIHDGYTPMWLGAGSTNLESSGKAHWGSKLINYAIKNSYLVLNIPLELRQIKKYSYPLDDRYDALNDIKKIIDSKTKEASQDIYFFNNENLKIAQVPKLNPKKLISVASGFKAIKILEQYNMGEESQVIYLDFSRNSLNYIKSICESEDLISLASKIGKFVKLISPQLYDEKLIEENCRTAVRDYFYNDTACFFKYLKLAKKAQYQFADIVKNPEIIVENVHKNESFIIWISNVYYNTHAYHNYSKAGMEDKFEELIKNISLKLDTKAFREIGTNTVIFGDSLLSPIGHLTDGATDNISYNPADWDLVT